MHFFHCVHASVQIEAGAGGFSDHSQLQPADILVQNWDLGRSVGLDISIVSLLNPSTLSTVGGIVGAVLEVMESRKHHAG